MKWLKNLKVGNKLGVSIGFISLITIIVALLGVQGMSQISKRAELMYSDNYIPSLMLSDISKKVYGTHNAYTNMIYNNNPNVQTQEYILNNIEEVNGRLASYAGYEKEEVADEMFTAMQTYIETYNEEVEKYVNLALQGQIDYAKAKITVLNDYVTQIDGVLDNLLSYNMEDAKAKSELNYTQTRKEQNMFMVIVLSGIVIGAGMALYLVKSIMHQLRFLGDATKQIAEGNLDVTISIDKEDEIGELARNFKRMSDNLNEVISNIDASAEQVTQGAKQVANTSIILAQGATEQASSIEELNTAIEEISMQITASTENVSSANEFAGEVMRKAHHGNQKMNQMLEGIKQIESGATHISKIIKVIDDIAFQTNILALNAAVEAARAGQHGKGFAVVAEEVRNLAARSAEAAKETTTMIENAIGNVGNVTSLTEETAREFEEIVEGIKQVAQSLNNINIACEEQATGIVQINQGTMQISNVIQSNSGTSEEVAAASEELAGQAEVMRNEVDKFQLSKLKTDYYNVENNMYRTEHKLYHQKQNINDYEFGKY